MPYGITQCYLPPGRGDIPALTPAKAGTRFSDPGGMQGWVDLQGTVITEMIDLVGSLHNIVLKISEATFLPNIIDIGQNLTKLLQKLQGALCLDTA